MTVPALLFCALGVSAQEPRPLPGYSAAASARERQLEADAVARPAPESAAVHARALAAEPHVAGTAAQARTRDYVVAQMKRWGLETEVRAYDVYMPHPTSVRVWRVAPDTQELPLAEGAPASLGPEVPVFNGSGAAGDVSGDVVYVGWGLAEDYAVLDSLGVTVRGRVAVARYGRSFRGIKAREAERRGAVALLIYSDPQDDGYVRGDVYPEGPMRPPRGVQRGSVFNGTGDPSTPGWPSVRGARRVPADSMEGVPRIPVVPLSYDNAARLLAAVRGAAVPQAWQGGLPFRYHAGPGPARARVQVTTDAASAPFKTIWNTLGTIRGSEFPDEYVVIGAHRDAWGPGAADNVSGTVSVLEAARAAAELARRGMRPRRTLVFATWDAEEWGLVGSTEFAEEDSLRLARGGVAYLNQDVAAQGPAFGGGGSPSLRGTLRDVARLVPDPKTPNGSVYAAWRARAGLARAAADTLEPAMGDPGGGSDFAGFYNHLGIPHAEWGFGGAGGVYHSMFDSPDWMARFGDPGYVYHAAAARVGAALLMRLANADVVPYDYVEYARTVGRHAAAASRAFAERGWTSGAPPQAASALAAAVERFARSAADFSAARDSALAAPKPPARAALAAANASLRGVERALTRPEGLRTRPWYRNLIYASDVDNGYSTMPLPSVNEALRAGDAALAAREAADLAERFGRAADALDAARRGLVGR